MYVKEVANSGYIGKGGNSGNVGIPPQATRRPKHDTDGLSAT